MNTETGRRRCGIPEHRRQIRAMQRWGHYLQARHEAHWRERASLQAEVNRLQALVWRWHRRRWASVAHAVICIALNAWALWVICR